MKTYAIRLKAEDFSEKVIVVHNATSIDDAENKAERVGLLDDYAILSTVEVVAELS